MKNRLSRFSFRPQSFLGGLCIFIMLLFGGVAVKQNRMASGATSCHALTVNHLPAKRNVTPKSNSFHNRIIKWAKPDNYYSRLGRAVILILVGLSIATIGFGIWSVSLFIAAKYVAAVIVGILSLASLFGIIKFLLS